MPSYPRSQPGVRNQVKRLYFIIALTTDAKKYASGFIACMAIRKNHKTLEGSIRDSNRKVAEKKKQTASNNVPESDYIKMTEGTAAGRPFLPSDTFVRTVETAHLKPWPETNCKRSQG